MSSWVNGIRVRAYGRNPYIVNAELIRVWEYLWDTYRFNGGVPRNISDAISLIQDRMEAVR